MREKGSEINKKGDIRVAVRGCYITLYVYLHNGDAQSLADLKHSIRGQPIG